MLYHQVPEKLYQLSDKLSRTGDSGLKSHQQCLLQAHRWTLIPRRDPMSQIERCLEGGSTVTAAIIEGRCRYQVDSVLGTVRPERCCETKILRECLIGPVRTPIAQMTRRFRFREDEMALQV